MRTTTTAASGPLFVTSPEMRNPLYRAFIDAGVEAGYARTEDMNGYRQEGFGADGPDHVPRAPLERGDGVSATRAGASESRGSFGRTRHARAVRRRARDRRRIRTRRPRGPCALPTRSDRRRRRDQLAADADALRHRQRRRAEATRDRAGRRCPGGRREPAGPHRDLRAARVHAADHALFDAESARDGEDRRRVAAVSLRTRRDQSLRGGRIHPQPRRRSSSGPAVSLPADRDGVRRQGEDRPARVPGARRTHATDVDGIGAPCVE